MPMWLHCAAILRTGTAPPPDWLPVVLFVAAIAGVPVGLFLFYRGFSLLARKRLIQNTPTSTIRSAALGQVELYGKAAGPYSILSPLSQTDCYYYKIEAHIVEGEGNYHSSRRKSVEALSVPFFLEDGTGSVMIDARGAESDLPCTFDEIVSTSSEGDCVRHFLHRRNLPEAGVRLVEHCIVEGDPLFVLGTLAENLPASPNAEAIAENEPGFLSREAADLQRREMLDYMHVPVPNNFRDSASADSPAREFDLYPPVILRKGASAEPFVISRHSEHEVVQELAGQSLLYIWGGPILALASLGYLLVRLAWW